MLAIEVALLAGRYVATSSDDRGRAEWPPHPARVFSALVAAHFEALDPPAEERAALLWLERQGAPEISAPEPSQRDGEDGPARPAAPLPDQRPDQARTVPFMTPAETSDGASPCVVFAWPGASPSAEERAALDTLAARVVRLGGSSSPASLRLSDEAPAATWRPAEEGAARTDDDTVLRVVGPGQLESLCGGFTPHAGAPGRLPALFQHYVRARARGAPSTPGTSFDDTWIVLHRVDGPRLPSVRAVDVARTLRKALMAAHGPNAPEILSGHRVSGGPSERPHLAYVPLPNVAHERADGAILGVALVLPRSATREERRAVHNALDAWERSVRERDEDPPRLPVLLGRTGVLGLARGEIEASQSILQAESWCAEATTWASATPVALDRNPGDLRSPDANKEAAAYAEAEATIALACERIGLPRPARVTAVPAPPLAGGDKVRSFPAFKVGSGTQRVLVHATLVFDAPVRGPILLGAGRYFGLGLFRPVRDPR